MNAFAVVGFIIAIGGLIFAADKFSHFATMAILGGALLGAIVVSRTGRRQATAKPSNRVDYDELQKKNIVQFAPWVKENCRGQDDVVDSILGSIQEELSLARRGKIIGAYLLAGPTGTGKTFVSQLIGQALYPESELIMLRMNQLKHPDDVFTLIGPPPGRAGYEVGGTLTRPVLENPYRVVIFDEIEKCHPDLHHCLYDILDSAQCREKSSNKVVDFSGCVFFGTSNAGVEDLRAVFKRTNDFNQRSSLGRDALAAAGGFDKAFLARWTRIELMDELAPVHVAEVALLQICAYWKEYGMEISYVPPEILLEAVERNEEFRSYGVRQLSTFIRRKTNQAINQARTAKINRVQLDVSPDGDLVVKPMR